jgi:hypothetical protein
LVGDAVHDAPSVLKRELKRELNWPLDASFAEAGGCQASTLERCPTPAKAGRPTTD